MTHNQERERAYKIERDLTSCAIRIYMTANKRSRWSKIVEDMTDCGYSRSATLGALMVMLIKKELVKNAVQNAGEEFPTNFFSLACYQNYHDQSQLSRSHYHYHEGGLYTPPT